MKMENSTLLTEMEEWKVVYSSREKKGRMGLKSLVSDPVVENNRNKNIGSNDKYKDFTENLQTQTGVNCRCGTELTGGGGGMDYIYGGQTVKVVSFIKHLLFIQPQPVSGKPVSLGGLAENNGTQRIFNLWRNTGCFQVHHHCCSLCACSEGERHKGLDKADQVHY